MISTTTTTSTSTTTPTSTTTSTSALGVLNTTYSGSLQNTSSRFNRYSGSSSDYFYDAIEIIPSTSGNYTITSKSDGNFDTYGYLYNNSFSLGALSVGLLAQDDDSGGNRQFQIVAYLQANVRYILIVTTYSINVVGNYSITASGPGRVSLAKSMISTTTTTSTSTTTPTSTTTSTSTTARTSTTTSTSTTARTSTTTSTSTTARTSTTTSTSTTARTSTTTSASTTSTSSTTRSTSSTTPPAVSGFLPCSLIYSASTNGVLCPSSYSWTTWFNVGKPSNATTGDTEDMSLILAQYPNSMCGVPYAVHAEGINPTDTTCTGNLVQSRPNSTLYLLSFQAIQPVGVDFRIRYCCPVGSFVAPPTTTPSPLENNSCGKQEIAPRGKSISRIYGGTDAIQNSWPWMVFYRGASCNVPPCASNVCGGTIISKDYVLTAAHCIRTTDASLISVTAGMHNYSSSTESNTRQTRFAQAIYVHPQYNTTGYINDIAVIRVSPPFTFNTYVQPACLPGPEPQPNDEVIIAGWGALTFGGPVNKVLKQAYTKVVDLCEARWANMDSSQQICVADSVDGNSACQGDSGGPILSQYQGQYVVSGVTSYGSDCITSGTNNKPNVFTRVSFYKSWIKSIIG
ncbi:unnamed protein product [Adineta ricciae]|nr:unnamed protein product [Adineta ricciae]